MIGIVSFQSFPSACAVSMCFKHLIKSLNLLVGLRPVFGYCLVFYFPGRQCIFHPQIRKIDDKIGYRLSDSISSGKP